MADKALDKAVAGLDDTRWDFIWGFKDSRFVALPDRTVTFTGKRYAISGTIMPEFIPFAEEILGLPVDLNKPKPEPRQRPVPEPNTNASFLAALTAAFPAGQFSQDARERLLRSHGQTTADEVYKVVYSSLERVVDLVFWPESERDVVDIIRLAAEHNVCLVPYGGGTSVSCALKLPTHEQEPRMIIAVDMRRMNKIEWIDRENQRACVQAGITGKQLEDLLGKEGFTCGHEPDSLELSTLGGWIATNASGMKKNRYGNIEEIVESATLITPSGVIEQLQTMPRISIGIQPQQMLFGSEGNLGLITKAVIRIHPLPEVKQYASVVFPDFKTGTAFLYALQQAGAVPASIRLLDNVQFRFGQALKPKPDVKALVMGRVQKTFLLKVKKFDPHELCAATIVMEGSAEEVAYQKQVIDKLTKQFGGVAGGATNGQRGYMLTYAIAYIRDFLAQYHIIGETYETTVPWSRIGDVIRAVAEMVERKHRELKLPGRPYISPRITQIYHTGVCIYFTHGFSTKGVENPDAIFSAIEHELRQAIIDNGGSLSHHHGIGKLRADFMPQMISPAGIALLKQIKQANDPQNVFGIRNNVFAE